MSHDDLERRIQGALSKITPPEATLLRAREAAVRGAERAAARRRRLARRSIGLLVAAAVLAAAATAGAIMWKQQAGNALPVSPEARPAIAESAILARAPWLVQPSGSPLIQEVRRLPALRFPPGTTYRAALTRLIRSVAATGTLPADASLVAALPRGAVWAPGKAGPRLDLTAPFAYAVPRGAISVPQFSIAGSVSPAEAAAIAMALRDGTPVGVGPARKLGVYAPPLRACQRLPRAAPCRLNAPAAVSR